MLKNQKEWDKLLRDLGASSIGYKYHPPEIRELLEKQQRGDILSGFELEKVQVAWKSRTPNIDNDGKPFILYIVDRSFRPFGLDPTILLLGKKESSYKFHFMHCQTQRTMLEKNKHSRYRAKYDIENDLFPNADEPPSYNDLNVCRHCLREYYKISYSEITNEMVKSFDVMEFFESCKAQYPELKMPVEPERDFRGDYPSNWGDLSREYRESQNWKCEKCGKDFSDLKEKRRCLHAHHINGDKRDSRPENLQALCCVCHSKIHNGRQVCICRMKDDNFISVSL